MNARTVVSIAFDDDRPEVAVRIWRITREEGEALAADFTRRFGPPISALAAQSALETFAEQPGVITDEQ